MNVSDIEMSLQSTETLTQLAALLFLLALRDCSAVIWFKLAPVSSWSTNTTCQLLEA